MWIDRLRSQFVVAMGLPTLAVACSSPRLNEDPNHPEVLPADAVTRSPLANGAWTIDYTEQPHSDFPTCPDGNFCIVGPGANAEGSADAPFQTCAAKVRYPGEVEGEPERHEVRFSPQWTAHERKAKDPSACCYSWYIPCPGGRAYRDDEGRALLPATARARSAARSAVDPSRAAYWAEAARSEHASVASFAQFAVELLALGAPAELVRRAHEAALDELAHAALALDLAASFGKEIALGPLPVAAASRLDPASVLLATLEDGCVGESLASLDAHRRAADAPDARERAALERIAEDEARHAALAFGAVAWMIRAFPSASLELERWLAAPRAGEVHQRLVEPCLTALLGARTSRQHET